MSNPAVVIIDYGVGNLLSVRRALEHCGGVVTVSSDTDEIARADRVILPGVGAFAKAMGALHERQLTEVVLGFAASGKPLLGICLGMQMLLEESLEFGLTPGLGLIAGRVEPIPTEDSEGHSLKVPHIGWTALHAAGSRQGWAGSVLQESAEGDEVYFVHSFRVVTTDPNHLLANGVFGGNPIGAVIRRDNVHGCQFHPEKSGEVGLGLLRQFLVL